MGMTPPGAVLDAKLDYRDSTVRSGRDRTSESDVQERYADR
jgi:hypothetical protein